MKSGICVLAAIGLASCSQAPTSTEQTVDQSEPLPVSSLASLTGRWRIVSLNDEPVIGREGEQAPYIAIAEDAVGGSIGCNRFGGPALYVQGRLAVHSWGGTVMNCVGQLGEQELTLSELFLAYPSVTATAGAIVITSDDHVLVLTDRQPLTGMVGSPDPMRVPVSDAPSQALANTSWRIQRIDQLGTGPSTGDRILRFSTDTWEGLAACATQYGSYELHGDRIAVGPELAATEQNCIGVDAKIDATFADLMRSDPHYSIGVNDELIVAGDAHVLTGKRVR